MTPPPPPRRLVCAGGRRRPAAAAPPRRAHARRRRCGAPPSHRRRCAAAVPAAPGARWVRVPHECMRHVGVDAALTLFTAVFWVARQRLEWPEVPEKGCSSSSVSYRETRMGPGRPDKRDPQVEKLRLLVYTVVLFSLPEGHHRLSPPHGLVTKRLNKNGFHPGMRRRRRRRRRCAPSVGSGERRAARRPVTAYR